jgi:hypothetical protein
MRLFSALFVAAITTASVAPAAPFPDQTGLSSRAVNETVRSGYYTGSGQTPTMRRQKVARILALRDEAYRLQIADGGTLSARTIAHIRNAVANIRSSGSVRNSDRAAACTARRGIDRYCAPPPLVDRVGFEPT